MQLAVITRAGRVLEMVAARHAGKLPADVIAAVLDSAIEIQSILRTEGVELANGESNGLSSLEAMRENGKGAPIRVRQGPVGRLDDMHAPAIPAKRKRNQKPGN